MMFTVFDLFMLDVMKSVEILTGQSGFQRQICNVGILDYEYISCNIYNEFCKNDLILSSFLFARDDIESMIQAVKALISMGVSCLGIKNIYYKEVPDELIRYAIENDFSIFIFGSDIFFENIIIEVFKNIRYVKNNQFAELKVEKLLSHDIDSHKIRELALDINKFFKEFFVVIFCKSQNSKYGGNSYRTLKRLKSLDFFKKEDLAFQYKDGIMVILTFDSDCKTTIQKIVYDFIFETKVNTDDFYIGVSDFSHGLSNFALGISESLYAFEACKMMGKSICLFDEIGLYRLTLPFSASPWAKKYYQSFLEPLLHYDENDEKKISELFNTLVAYIEYDRNIKKTAEHLYQHENTIRYRINKIEELLDLDKEDYSIYPQLCIAIHLYKLDQRNPNSFRVV